MEEQAEYKTPNVVRLQTKEEILLESALGVCKVNTDDVTVALIIELHKAVVEKQELLTLDDVIKIKVGNDKRFAEINESIKDY